MAYSKDMREAAIAHYQNTDDSMRRTAATFGIATATFQSWKERYTQGLSLQARTSPGRKRKLTPEQEQRMIEFIEEHPDWTQAEYGKHFSSEFGTRITGQFVSRILKRWKVTRKKNSGKRMKQKVKESRS